MPSRDCHPVAVLVAMLLTSCAATQTPTPVPAPRPAGAWRQFATPEEAGFSSAALDKAFALADSLRSGAVMVVSRGRVVAAWGDIARKLELHSVRKSLVSALFGIAAERGEISFDRTLADLGIDDRTPLTAVERTARVRDLLAARSGVYLPAAYADASQEVRRPERGSHPPGSHWFYNNWDFNTLGTIYEKAVGAPLFESLDRRLAQPLGMEDYSPDDGFMVFEPSNSNHPAYTIRMSTRDLARFGQLYLQDGAWNGRQVVPAAWVHQSTMPISAVGVGRGYGDLWWTWAPGAAGGERPLLNQRQLFYGEGTGGQLVIVIPEDDLVVVHRGDTDHGRLVPDNEIWRLVELILEAKVGAPVVVPTTRALAARPLSSQLPAETTPRYLDLTADQVAELVGDYQVAPKVVARVFAFRGRLFGNFPGLGEAELFALPDSTFTIRVRPGVRLRFDRDDAGRITGLSGSIGPQRVRAVRQ